MTKVQQIEQQIQELDEVELSELRNWFTQFDADAWDRQIEADVKAGKLDALADRALRAKAAGRTTEL